MCAIVFYSFGIVCGSVDITVDVRYGCVCFQAEDGIRDLVRSRGLGDVYKIQREVLLEAAQVDGDGVCRLPLTAQSDGPRLRKVSQLSLIHI